ncbi:hypothetical protein ACQPZA_11290 [Pseudonocardia xinjiangensis]|uniref:hypothetical protein n=1 Tax=Pseudonocardia xinjiangensis TaxID=75289 RepID=UPI003D8E4205
MNEQERSEFRAFVREHHPDRGGDPEVFVAGLARFGTARPGADDVDGPGHDPSDARYDAPVEVVGPLPFPVRVGVALIRTWHRRRHRRVE